MGAPKNRSACRKEGFVAHRTPWEERDLRNVDTNPTSFVLLLLFLGQDMAIVSQTVTLFQRQHCGSISQNETHVSHVLYRTLNQTEVK